MNKVAVIGIGRLGLCVALLLEKAGYYVIGIDKDEAYVEKINKRQLSSNEPELENLLAAAKSLYVTTDFTELAKQEIQFIYCFVPTPSTESFEFSHDAIIAVVNSLKSLNRLNSKQNLIVGSTTMPGFCDTLAISLENENISVTYCPEFIAQGSIIRDLQYPDQVIIGEGEVETTNFIKEVCNRICLSEPQIHILDRKSAEISKLATNCFLTMKISFANAIGDLATKVGANPDLILNAIGSDKRIGNKYLNYGYGFGGPCFPRDNQSLIAYAKKQNQQLYLSEATMLTNKTHFEFQLNQFLESENKVFDFESLAYKNGTDILEESQQLQLALKLIENGRKVRVKANENMHEKLNKLFPNTFDFY
jgi:UDPglucose 6-dehydrogenase